MLWRFLLEAWVVAWRVVLGVCFTLCLGLVVVVAAAYLWMPDACDTAAGPRISNPLRPGIWARTSTKSCSGFGAGFSRARVEVGRGSASGTIVFSQDSEAPDIRWSARGDLEINVQTTDPIATSEVRVDGIGIDYVIPRGLTKQSLERDLSAWRALSRSSILAGTVTLSGGSKAGDLANLERYAGARQAKIEGFSTWSAKVHAHVE